MSITFTILIALLNPSAAVYADDESVLLKFNEVARKAKAIFHERGIDAAIRTYQDALLDESYGDYGQIHLKLAQLLVKRGDYAAAAKHYRVCMRDVRVSNLDRDIICKGGFNKITHVVTVTALPEGGRVSVVEPVAFAGPLRPGTRLPRGQVVLLVESPGRKPRTTPIAVNGPTTWRARIGMTKRKGPLVPDNFLATEQKAETNILATPAPMAEPIRWPAYTAAAVGLALVGTGVFIGQQNRDELAQIRIDQQQGTVCGAAQNYCNDKVRNARMRAGVADGLWISGATLAASSVLFWYLFDGTGSAEDERK